MYIYLPRPSTTQRVPEGKPTLLRVSFWRIIMRNRLICNDMEKRKGKYCKKKSLDTISLFNN